MLYPEKINAKKSNFIIKILLLSSILVALILSIINKLTNPDTHWAALANAGIVYAWITVMYSINRNTNIAKHVLIQIIAISILTWYIDYSLGFKGWSVRISIPIVIITANATMFILTIISRKKYIRYAIYQLLIIILSLLPVFSIFKHTLEGSILTIIASSISIINFIVSLLLCAKGFKEAIIRKFHT